MQVNNGTHTPRINVGRVMGYRCEQVLRYINATLEREGIAPSYAMIGHELGIDKSDVGKMVKRLERRGLLRRVGVFRTPRGTHSRNVRRILLG